MQLNLEDQGLAVLRNRKGWEQGWVCEACVEKVTEKQLDWYISIALRVG